MSQNLPSSNQPISSNQLVNTTWYRFFTDEHRLVALVETESDSFTPTMSFATVGNSTWAYTTQFGTFYRIGRLVWFHILVVATPTKGTGAGNVQVLGLPYASGSTTDLTSALTEANWLWPVGNTMTTGILTGSTAICTIRGSGSAVAGTVFTIANMTDGASHTLRLSGTYGTA